MACQERVGDLAPQTRDPSTDKLRGAAVVTVHSIESKPFVLPKLCDAYGVATTGNTKVEGCSASW